MADSEKKKNGSTGAKKRIFMEETYSVVIRFKHHKRLVGTKKVLITFLYNYFVILYNAVCNYFVYLNPVHTKLTKN